MYFSSRRHEMNRLIYFFWALIALAIVMSLNRGIEPQLTSEAKEAGLKVRAGNKHILGVRS
jgi:hypothetical protein